MNKEAKIATKKIKTTLKWLGKPNLEDIKTLYMIFDKNKEPYFVTKTETEKLITLHLHSKEFGNELAEYNRIGYIDFQNKKSMNDKTNNAEIKLVKINRYYSDLGLGKQLMKLAMYESFKEGAQKVHATVIAMSDFVNTIKTWHFYDSLGFKFTGNLKELECAYAEKSLDLEEIKSYENNLVTVNSNNFNTVVVANDNTCEPLKQAFDNQKTL